MHVSFAPWPAANDQARNCRCLPRLELTRPEAARPPCDIFSGVRWRPRQGLADQAQDARLPKRVLLSATRMNHTPAARAHVNHEIAQAIELGLRFAGTIPADDLVIRSMRVAYAAHFRALMEFFQEIRPTKTNPNTNDWQASDFLPPRATNPFRAKWPKRLKARFDAADKLLGHLSRGRQLRHHTTHEWGDRRDHEVVVRRARWFLNAIPQARTWFPEAVAAITKCG